MMYVIINENFETIAESIIKYLSINNRQDLKEHTIMFNCLKSLEYLKIYLNLIIQL